MGLINEDLGLTSLGYGVFIAVAVVCFLLASLLLGKLSKKKSSSAKRLAFCALALALAFVTSYIKIVGMPWGGSVTLCSMLFIVLIGYWYGPATGMMIGFVYGILQFIQEPFVLTPFQVCCDYLFAFTALGLAGFFKGKKFGLTIGYVVAVIGRGFFHVLGGYLYWMDYMPEEFHKQYAAVYPIAYNFSFLLVEMVITIVIFSIPSVSAALERVSRMANDEAA